MIEGRGLLYRCYAPVRSVGEATWKGQLDSANKETGVAVPEPLSRVVRYKL